MINLSARNGFTLIELVMVVLIIAVLVAVAAAQYKTAVTRVKYLKLQRVARKVMQAEQAYKSAYGDFTVDLDVLDIDFSSFKSEHKVTQAEAGEPTFAAYRGFHGETLVLINTSDYLEIRMSSNELPVSFQMFDWHYPDLIITPEVMKEHLIESYCRGTADTVTESRRICGAFGADTTRMSPDYSWKF